MLKTFKSNLWLNIKNIPGWQTNRNILVIEADDYGSINIPPESYEELVKKGLTEQGSYNNIDTIETPEDLNAMYKVLKSVRDMNGSPARITPFVNPANPDCAKIVANDFLEYAQISYKELVNSSNFGTELNDLWQEGISEGFFKPQYHGREHVNVPKLVQLMHHKNSELIEALKLGYFHPPLRDYSHYKRLRPAFYFENSIEKEYLNKSIIDGEGLFVEYFGYQPTVFCPSNGTFHETFKRTLSLANIKTIVESGIRYIPDGEGGTQTERKFIFGKFDKSTQTMSYSRNVTFEPSRDGATQSVKKALREVAAAFRWNKPAVVATHRINYCGTLLPVSREESLTALKTFLEEVKRRWPRVEFMSSETLAALISKSYSELR